MIDVHHIEQISQDCSLTEFVGTTVLDTIGLVIPGIDPSLLEKMNLKKAYKSLGLISSRTGAAGQINAADEAVKSTNTEIVSIDLPRDTKGWGGHGCFIVIGGDNVRLTLHLNISVNMPVSSTSARPDIWSSLSLPVQTKHFIWHSTLRLENHLDSSAVPLLLLDLSWLTLR